MSRYMAKKETMLTHDPFSTEKSLLWQVQEFPSSLYQKRGQIKSSFSVCSRHSTHSINLSSL